MKRAALVLPVLIFISVIVLLVFFSDIYFKSQIKEVCIGDKKCFEVEVADSDEEMVSGLSFRNSLEENKGMLFIFKEKTIPRFWMKGMNFPLDMIWINFENKISEIDKNAETCFLICPTFSPTEEIIYVLEINANLSEEYNFEIGDEILIK